MRVSVILTWMRILLSHFRNGLNLLTPFTVSQAPLLNSHLTEYYVPHFSYVTNSIWEYFSHNLRFLTIICNNHNENYVPHFYSVWVSYFKYVSVCLSIILCTHRLHNWNYGNLSNSIILTNLCNNHNENYIPHLHSAFLICVSVCQSVCLHLGCITQTINNH